GGTVIPYSNTRLVRRPRSAPGRPIDRRPLLKRPDRRFCRQHADTIVVCHEAVMSSESNGSTIDPQRHVEVLRRAVADAVQQLRAANFTLVSVALYLFVAGLGTNHRDLLVGRMVKLPIFDVEVSLLWFYLLAPDVLVILHFTVLSLCGT